MRGVVREEMAADGGNVWGRKEPKSDVALTWQMFTTQTYSSSILPVVATRESLQNSIDAVRSLALFAAVNKVQIDASYALLADPTAQSRFSDYKAKRGTEPNVRTEAEARRLLEGGWARFDVYWDAVEGTLTWTDNGIGMDAETTDTKFLTIPATGKGDSTGSGVSAGGFGVAKAVIIGAGIDGFLLRTRDVVAEGWLIEDGKRYYDLRQGPMLNGTSITVKGLVWDYSFDTATRRLIPRRVAKDGTYDVPVDENGYRVYANSESRGSSLRKLLRVVLASSNLPELTITLNGDPVAPLFPVRGGSLVPEYSGVWEGTTENPVVSARIKGYKRGDRQGGVYMRLDGLYQFAQYGGGELKKDYVVDLTTTRTPMDPRYPLTNSRETLKGVTKSRFESMVDRLKEESREPVITEKEYETFLPDAEGKERNGAEEIAAAVDAAFGDADVAAALNDSVGAVQDFYREVFERRVRNDTPREREEDEGSNAPPIRNERVPEDEVDEDRSTAEDDARVTGDLPADGPLAKAPPMAILPTAEAQAQEIARAVDDPRVAHVALIVRVFDAALVVLRTDNERGATAAAQEIRTGQRGAETLLTLDRYAWNADRELRHVFAALGACVRAAYRVSGGGILQAMGVKPALDALNRLTTLFANGQQFALEMKRRSPFGGAAGLTIKRTYPRWRARRFRDNYSKYIPLLVLWDVTLRLLIREGQVARAKGSQTPILAWVPTNWRPGFVLDAAVHALAANETGENDETLPLIYVNPDDLMAVVRAHKTRPIAIAGFLWNMAVHELSHMNGKMGDRHDHGFVVAREHLGLATAHLLPIIERLVITTLRLTPSMPDAAKEALKVAMRQTAMLERKLEKAQAAVKAARDAAASATPVAAVPPRTFTVAPATVETWLSDAVGRILARVGSAQVPPAEAIFAGILTAAEHLAGPDGVAVRMALLADKPRWIATIQRKVYGQE